MKTLVAILMGGVSGFLIYMISLMSVIGPGTSSGVVVPLVFITFIGGWVASSWLLLRGAADTSAVFRRGFLLGAGEWLAVGAAGLVMSGRVVSSTSDGSSPSTAGAALSGGIFAALAGGVAVFMAVVCLIGFAIAYFAGREMKNTTSTPSKRCPECAEMIQPEARKCRYCGADVTAPVEV